MTALTRLYRRLDDALARAVPADAVALAARWCIGAVFWQSGRT